MKAPDSSTRTPPMSHLIASPLVGVDGFHFDCSHQLWKHLLRHSIAAKGLPTKLACFPKSPILRLILSSVPSV